MPITKSGFSASKNDAGWRHQHQGEACKACHHLSAKSEQTLFENQAVKRPVTEQKKPQRQRKLLPEIPVHFIPLFFIAYFYHACSVAHTTPSRLNSAIPVSS
ncbi:hypothetical protein [Herminiimonas sp.]|uniref:hypothetical protein n=1 Tax=Herminiimonas sp. TaxID=1926289 RepID=UPI002716F609|nr:hypothetical protein [Herminiimonas sp.]MDO8304842.1 hypothetical protein [Herminiimonas sp.]